MNRKPYRLPAALLLPAAAVCLLPGCRLAERLLPKAPEEESGQPLECEQDTPPAVAEQPSPGEVNPMAKKGDTIPFQPSEDGMVSPFSPEKPHEKRRPEAPVSAPRSDLPRGPIRRDSRRLSAGGRTVAVTVLDVPLGSFRLQVGLAKDRVGCTESLAAIARRHHAVAAINGCFFDAYSKRPVRNPYGALILGGQVLYVSDHPTTLGVWPDGTVAIGQVKFHLLGDSGHHDPWLRKWYAYGLNQSPEGETCATVFTPQWSQRRSPEHGLYVVVRDNRIESKGYGAAEIPPNGYVVYLRGAEVQLDKRFQVGRECTYELTAESADGPDWLSVQEALGCGPLLVRNGEVSVDPRAEGFRDPKVLADACNRSAVGLTAEGHILLVTSSAATIPELAQAMRTLGCRSGMNLDGGASSGLFHQDTYLTRPGRDIANVLLVLSH